MLYSQAKKKAVDILLAAGIDEAGVDAEYLLQQAAEVDRSTLFMILSESIPEEIEYKYFELIRRRSSHEPLQYILGNQDFMGYTFIVTPDVLIPRFDTEILAEQSIKRAKERLNTVVEAEPCTGSFRYLDLCTGSGCVAASVGFEIMKYALNLKQLSAKHKKAEINGIYRFNIEVIGADISEAAVELAKKNWELNLSLIDRNLNGDRKTVKCKDNITDNENGIQDRMSVSARFLKSDLFEEIDGRFDIITANPPYIVRDEISTLMPEIQEHEPYLALDGGQDGMDFYRRICKDAPKYLLPGGRLLMEFDDLEAEPVAKMMEEAGFKEIEVHRDLAGLRRIIEGVICLIS